MLPKAHVAIPRSPDSDDCPIVVARNDQDCSSVVSELTMGTVNGGDWGTEERQHTRKFQRAKKRQETTKQPNVAGDKKKTDHNTRRRVSSSSRAAAAEQQSSPPEHCRRDSAVGHLSMPRNEARPRRRASLERAMSLNDVMNNKTLRKGDDYRNKKHNRRASCSAADKFHQHRHHEEGCRRPFRQESNTKQHGRSANNNNNKGDEALSATRSEEQRRDHPHDEGDDGKDTRQRRRPSMSSSSSSSPFRHRDHTKQHGVAERKKRKDEILSATRSEEQDRPAFHRRARRRPSLTRSLDSEDEDKRSKVSFIKETHDVSAATRSLRLEKGGSTTTVVHGDRFRRRPSMEQESMTKRLDSRRPSSVLVPQTRPHHNTVVLRGYSQSQKMLVRPSTAKNTLSAISNEDKSSSRRNSWGGSLATGAVEARGTMANGRASTSSAGSVSTTRTLIEPLPLIQDPLIESAAAAMSAIQQKNNRFGNRRNWFSGSRSGSVDSLIDENNDKKETTATTKMMPSTKGSLNQKLRNT